MVRHLLLAVALLGLVLTTGIHYDVAHERHAPYPSNGQIDRNYGQFVGEQVLFFGRVLDVGETNGTATIAVGTGSGEFTMQVSNFTADVASGGHVQVYGELQENRTLAATRVVVVERSGSDRLRKYALSGGGALLALVSFFRRWRIEWSSLTFEVSD